MSETWNHFIHVRSPKFAPLPGEDEEVVNPGMYGKALSLFLQEELVRRGHKAPSVIAEDWGWWVELADDPVKGGVCVYCGPGQDGTLEFACCLGFSGAKKWSWKKFGSVDLTEYLGALYNDVLDALQRDADVEVLGTSEECPVGDEA